MNMKSLLIVFSLVFCGFAANADQWTKITNDTQEAAKIELVQSGVNQSVIHFSFGGFIEKKVETDRGVAVVVELPKGSPIMQKGTPDLPKLTASVIIPERAKMMVKVLDFKAKEFYNYEIAPSKGNLYRDVDPATVPFEYAPIYNEDGFSPESLSYLRDPHIIRDYRGQTVVVQPFQYNPVTKTLKVFYDITVEVSYVDESGINPLVGTSEPEKIDIEFQKLYKQHFLNGNASRYDVVGEYGNMLIISYGSFMSTMQPYIDWRIQAGRPTEIVDVASIGGSAAIKTYIANYFNDNGLTFVLLIGDSQQVPSSYSSGDSDNDYSYIVGNDHYPDVFVGRFSAENVQEVQTQVDRTIDYEKNPTLNGQWQTIGIGIASDQGPGDDNEYDYVHIRNINDDLLGYTYTYCHELFDGSQGGEDAPGNPSSSQVAQVVNDGGSIINYTGHGSDNSWSTTGFSSSNVNSLTNDGLLPFIFSVACVNGNFVGQDCFAEAWMRAENNGKPTGAIATIMSTINQSWNPPMGAQDEMNDILVESYPDRIMHSFGAITMHACMQMNDEYGGEGDEMTDTWNIFGDPSISIRTAVPQNITATYMSTLFLGMDQLVVSSDAEGGLVALTQDGVIIATAFIQGGSATLEFDALTELGIFDIVITSYNFIPHINQIQILPSNTPYLVFQSFNVQDSLNNGNHMVEPGETIFMCLNVNNMGGVDAQGIEVELSMNDPLAELIDNNEVYGLIEAGQTLGVDDGFCFSVSPEATDQYIVNFDMVCTDQNDSTWTDDFQVKVNAPILRIGDMTIDDSEWGNNNGRMDAGETVKLTVKNYNDGHSMASNSIASLQTACQYLTMLNTVDTIGVVGFFGHVTAEFVVEVADNAPSGSWIAEFEYELVSGSYFEEKDFSKKIGLIYDDFESGDFTKFNWQMDGDVPWATTTQYTYEGFYSAKSGDIDNNQTSELEVTLDIMVADSISFIRKVSSESSDKLKFYIGNTLKGEWSGASEGWQEESFAVTAGMKNFRWVYSKNGSGSAGSDCAWLDYVVFPPIMCLTCYAGVDDYVCASDVYQCQGEATDYETLEWTTSGSGTFDDNTILDPVYSPSTDDYSNGTVELKLSAWNSDGDLVEDITRIEFMELPTNPAIPVGPDYIDITQTTASEYSIDPVDFASAYFWEISPAEAGTISGATTLSQVEWNVNYLGEAQISVQAVNDCGTGEWSEALTVLVDNATTILNAQAGQLKVYPNPVIDRLTIECAFADDQQLEINIFNTFGKLVFNGNLNNQNNTQIDLSGLSDGIYFIKLHNDNISIIEKFVKK
jgi:Peptidase family C25/Propeptide_C25/Secretion system C-terminal sorting domain/Peptidase family C25, C terminal ig-like domain/PKD-like domain